VLIGRETLCEELTQILADTASGRGALVLLAGEAGVGKTRLATEIVRPSGLFTLTVTAGPATAAPFGPLVAAWRAFMRVVPEGLPLEDRLSRFLPILLPELGAPPGELDRATMFEVVRSAFLATACHEPTVVFIDDLHEADHATLEVLPFIAEAIINVPLLLLCAYRTDELRRDHPLRRMRSALRRASRLRELAVGPLNPEDTAVLAANILGGPASPSVAGLLFERTDGLPLLVEELLAALLAAGRIHESHGSWELIEATTLLPVPDTVKDLVLLRATRLSEPARGALEIAAVAGPQFDLDMVAELAGGEEILGEPLAHGLLIEIDPGMAAFRHGLIRDAFYSDIAWPRRRTLHRQLAERLEQRGAAHSVVAEHWLAGREPERARRALLLGAETACRARAYRDAADLAQRALELWPEAKFEAERIATLDRFAECAQINADLSAAAAAWREVAESHSQAGQNAQHALVERRLAGVYELQGAWEQALAARQVAARSFAASGQPGDAAAERLAAAAHLRSAASFSHALELLGIAAAEAQRAERVDLQARILGLEGDVRARLGQFEEGIDEVRRGLSLALQHNLSGPAAEVYQRLADALEHAGDYHTAQQTYLEAAAFCQARQVESTAQLCLACMTVVLRQIGAWDRCAEICGQVLASEASSAHARAVALGMFGLVRAFRGDALRARPLLLESARHAAHIELTAMELLTAWGLAIVDQIAGNDASAAERFRGLIERWNRTEERHYTTPALRWAVTLFAVRGEATDARACANALATIVAETGTSEAVSALAHALGELSLLDGDPARAAGHFIDALERLGCVELPHEEAHTRLRAGVALIAAGERDRGIQQLVESYRVAQSLGARPLLEAVAHELARLGERIDRMLGRRAAGRHQRGGLTRRELEVLQHVAEGQSDREIARALVLSPRTVEMHVANCLTKLGCRSRAEAVHRATELRLIGSLARA
jgi:DNA-binding NarL/FixJ family response regulator